MERSGAQEGHGERYLLVSNVDTTFSDQPLTPSLTTGTPRAGLAAA